MKQTGAGSELPTIVSLSVALYRWLIKLGPAGFRREYAVPAIQDFRQCCRDAYSEKGNWGVLRLWPRLLGETVTGVLAEYWTELFGRKRVMLPTIRRSMVATFGAFVLFFFAYAAIARIADPAAPFEAAGRIHPEVALSHLLVIYSGEIGLLTLILGGVPFLLTAVKHAIPGGFQDVVKLFLIKPKQGIYLLVIALLITICSLGFLWITQFIFGSTPCTSTNGCIAGQPLLLIILDFAAIVGVVTLGVFIVLVVCTSLSLAILRSEYSNGMLRFALVPIGIMAVAMAITTIAASIWTIRLWIDAPQFAASGAGLGDGQTVWVMGFIAAMTVATVVAGGALASGVRASMAQLS